MTNHDLVIRNGTVIDGTGADRFTADVAVSDGIITDVGTPDHPMISGSGHREIDADGRLVQPGFVDIHTHYDGQATWDAQLAPSSWHGVTTVVMGNCGVGFAPVRPDDHNRLIELMEGVEDIPGTALHEGLPWTWESFEEYLDHLDQSPHDIDLGAQVPHAALRLNVMGERGAQREAANDSDIQQMATLARRAIEAGALGFTTSRTVLHKSSLGEPTPTLNAEFAELIAIAEAIGSTGKGVLQLISDFGDFGDEFHLAHEMARRSGRPISISVAQTRADKDRWRLMLDKMHDATNHGVTMRGQVGARPVGVLMGHLGTLNPFMHCPTYVELRNLPFPEMIAELRRPDTRQRILTEDPIDRSSPRVGSRLVTRYADMYPLGDPPNYEPAPDQALTRLAETRNTTAAELAYDLMLADDGAAMIYLPTANYVDENLDHLREQLLHPASVPGLSDGGAHVGTICDVSFPTTLMQWWGRDRPTGTIPLETIVHKQAAATAHAVDLHDRGTLTPGKKADVNVIDFDRLALHQPEIVNDLPGGSRRFIQRVTGIDHTFVAGVEVARNSNSTGETPGRLVRGAQPSKA